MNILLDEIIAKNLSLLDVSNLCQTFHRSFCQDNNFWLKVGLYLFPNLTSQLLEINVGRYYLTLSRFLVELNKVIYAKDQVTLEVSSPGLYQRSSNQYWENHFDFFGISPNWSLELVISKNITAKYMLVALSDEVIIRFYPEKEFVEFLTSLLILSGEITTEFQQINQLIKKLQSSLFEDFLLT